MITQLHKDDRLCDDEEIITKCRLLDIEIWCNGGRSYVDIKYGQWFVLRRAAEGWLCWNKGGGNEELVVFNSARGAFDAFVSNPNKYKFG